MTCYLMASMSSCTESRIHKDHSLDEPLLNLDKNFETDSKFSLSSFASTRLPPLSNFSGEFGAPIFEVIEFKGCIRNWYTNSGLKKILHVFNIIFGFRGNKMYEQINFT